MFAGCLVGKRLLLRVIHNDFVLFIGTEGLQEFMVYVIVFPIMLFRWTSVFMLKGATGTRIIHKRAFILWFLPWFVFVKFGFLQFFVHGFFTHEERVAPLYCNF